MKKLLVVALAMMVAASFVSAQCQNLFVDVVYPMPEQHIMGGNTDVWGYTNPECQLTLSLRVNGFWQTCNIPVDENGFFMTNTELFVGQSFIEIRATDGFSEEWNGVMVSPWEPGEPDDDDEC